VFQGRIEPQAQVRVEIVRGFPPALDAIARSSPGGRCFLRAAWYEAAASGLPMTVLATREDGSPVAAIPTSTMGPPLVGAKSVPGSYWPFRSILIAADAQWAELTETLSAPQVRRALAPVWRVGPVLRDDPATVMLEQAAAAAGWTILVRPLGQTFVLPLGELVSSGQWPRKSTRKRLANYERQLAREGSIEFRFVSGDGWDYAAFEALATVEANSWVGKSTDGSGAKFLKASQRDHWRRAMADPHIAGALSATILSVGGKPAAFSFDLRAGDRQYSIASSYDETLSAARPGKIVTYRQLEWAAAQGVQLVDLGTGDSGYKQEMGAEQGSEIIDLLIVRSRSLAQILRFKWGAESELGRSVFLSSAHAQSRRTRIRQILAASATAGTAFAAIE
jgi:CelD/BcsL family acetyltransferase involved in cellulose biosynthesis